MLKIYSVRFLTRLLCTVGDNINAVCICQDIQIPAHQLNTFDLMNEMLVSIWC